MLIGHGGNLVDLNGFRSNLSELHLMYLAAIETEKSEFDLKFGE